jgi:serine/threonine protein kinase
VNCYTPHTLKHDLKTRGRLPPNECVEIGLALTTALAHLHSHGLVHRDIKPSNIIFVDGAPKLADIGLVTDASEARSFVGTIGFIPPEGPGRPQADLYSLGKVLYEISTGKDRQDFPQLPPELLRGTHPGSSRREEAHSKRSAICNPQYPQSEIDQSLRASAATNQDTASLIELNEVLLRACHKDVRQRYASAKAMLADLQLLQRGESIRRKRTVERWLGVAKRLTIAAAVSAMLVWGATSFLSSVSEEPGPLRDSRGTTNEEAFMAY